MKNRIQLPFILTLLFSFIIGNLFAEIVTYNWPKSWDLQSGRYTIRVRQLDSGEKWIDLHEFNSIPRKYERYRHGFPLEDFHRPNRAELSHKICGGDATSSTIEDRDMTFAIFSFTGSVEIEITKNYGKIAEKVELSPKAFGFNPHFFDGKTVRFAMDQPRYVSVNFVTPDNQDNDERKGICIKHSLMIFADIPEHIAKDYDIPKPTDPGVIVWDNKKDIDEIRKADIIYFPPGDWRMKEHKDSKNHWEKDVEAYLSYPIYHGQMRFARAGQKVYIAGGAYVRGTFRTHGLEGCWVYGRGIVSGRDHVMHELIKYIGENKDGSWTLKTKSKEAFLEFIGTEQGHIQGITIMEAYHHTCPSGPQSTIRRVKIIGWAANNDGTRTGSGSLIENCFYFCGDDHDYAANYHISRNNVFWPRHNGAVAMMGWNVRGDGGAIFENNYIINSEWSGPSKSKQNTGVLCGSKANGGMKHKGTTLRGIKLENYVNYLVQARLEKADNDAEGLITDFLFENCTTEYPFRTPSGIKTPQEIAGTKGTWIQNWTFTNLIVDGVLVTWDNHKDYFKLDLVGSNGKNVDEKRLVRDFTFNSKGKLYTINVKITGNGACSPKGNNGKIQVIGGESQIVNFNPAPNHRIKSISLDGKTVYQYGDKEKQNRQQVVLFNRISQDHSINISFEPGADHFELAPVLFVK